MLKVKKTGLKIIDSSVTFIQEKYIQLYYMEVIARKESESLQNTIIPSLKTVNRQWYFFDLKVKRVGKLAPRIAEILRGKNKNYFLPNSDLGDCVVLINAKHVVFTGDKLNGKNYYNHSGYPGGLRTRSTKVMLESYPCELVFRIIKGMVPRTKLGKGQLKRLFIFADDKHNLQAQEKNFVKIDL